MSAEHSTNAVGYVRVASGSSRKREGSIYLQRQAILRYAKDNGIRIARFFADHACIADIELRQGLIDAMAFIASGKASVLIVADVTRITRSAEGFLRFIEQHRFLKDVLGFISVQERVDTRTAEGRVMLGTLHALGTWESSELARGV
jgi:DNA invertase Pin-like site-specific DNA recombinase